MSKEDLEELTTTAKPESNLDADLEIGNDEPEVSLDKITEDENQSSDDTSQDTENNS